MNLMVDGRTIQLDESVDRVVIEKAPNGTLTVSSHFGVKRVVIEQKKKPVVDHTAFVEPVARQENGTGSVRQQMPMAALGFGSDKDVAVKTKRKSETYGKTCLACGKRQGTRAYHCINCGVPFPGHE